MKKYCILAWYPPNPEKKLVVVDNADVVRLFDDYKVAWDWAVNQMTPDWEFVVLPINTLFIEVL